MMRSLSVNTYYNKKASRLGGLNIADENQAAALIRLRTLRENPKAAAAPKMGSGPGTVLEGALVTVTVDDNP